MKLFVLSELEAHLIAAHGIKPQEIAQSREHSNHSKSSEAAHELLHKMGEQSHTHEEEHDR